MYLNLHLCILVLSWIPIPIHAQKRDKGQRRRQPALPCLTQLQKVHRSLAHLHTCTLAHSIKTFSLSSPSSFPSWMTVKVRLGPVSPLAPLSAIPFCSLPFLLLLLLLVVLFTTIEITTPRSPYNLSFLPSSGPHSACCCCCFFVPLLAATAVVHSPPPPPGTSYSNRHSDRQTDRQVRAGRTRLQARARSYYPVESHYNKSFSPCNSSSKGDNPKKRQKRLRQSSQERPDILLKSCDSVHWRSTWLLQKESYLIVG
ncbi:MAG: hypothetical protein J3Q66DRAFT_346389 [Benniella sp.]|nr:MAG: hypothetical protein J3Q66DRAFT_346389 [Benniella sp.]